MYGLLNNTPPPTHTQNSKGVEEDGAESRAGACPFPSLGLAVPGGTLCVWGGGGGGRRWWWWWSEHRALSFPEGGPADWKPEHSGPQPSGTGLPSRLLTGERGWACLCEDPWGLAHNHGPLNHPQL